MAGARSAAFSKPEADSEGSRLVAGSFTNATGTLTYKGYRPRNARKHPPLFVMLHGAMQSADEFASITHMNDVADECGALVLYPEQSTWAHPLVGWNWYDCAHQFADGGEPALIAGATRQFCAMHGVSPRHVYVAGMSAGGAMAVVLGDVFPELFAAVGVHSGLPVGAANDCLSALQAMTSGPAATREDAGGFGGGERSAVRTIAFHGDRDTTVHPANGHAILDQACRPGTPLPPSGSLISERIRTSGGSAVTRVTRTGDRGISLAELWIIHGGGHVWSGGGEGESDSAPGPDASREMARFFLEH